MALLELHGAEVLHVDSDYDMIARVTDQPMRRLFDPGPMTSVGGRTLRSLGNRRTDR